MRKSSLFFTISLFFLSILGGCASQASEGAAAQRHPRLVPMDCIGNWYSDMGGFSGMLALKIISVNDRGLFKGDGVWYGTSVGSPPFSFEGTLLDDGTLWIPREWGRWFRLELWGTEDRPKLRGRYSAIGSRGKVEGEIRLNCKPVS